MVQGLTFGQCAFETGTTRIDPESDVHFGLLLLLAAGDVGGVQRDEIVSMLWPSSDDESSRHCLRQAMYRLRQLGAPVRLRGGRVSMPADECALDLRQILWGKPPRDELIRLGGLQFLPGYAPKLSAPFAQWVEELRQRVSGRLRRVLADEIADARSNDRYHQVGRLARALLLLDPLNETATLGLAESMALEGSKVEAIRMLEAYEEEVGAVSGDLRIPARLLRRRVSECLDDSLLPRHFEVPFVGRERELTELRTLFRLTRDGIAQTAMVTGEAGIGKTRLATELLRLAALDGATVATYNTSAGDTFTPLTTLVTVSQLLLSLPGALGCGQEHLAFVRRLGTPETVSPWAVSGLAAEVAYAQMVNALAELVAAIADEAPFILVIDDAHRLHQTTWRILMDLMERASTRRVLIVLTARQLPEWFGTLGARSCERLTRHVRLVAFEREESLQFLTIWSSRNRVPITPDDASACATTSQGNPFYLGELAGHIGRGGDPRGAPASIRELIEMQHAALSKAGQRTLLAIALLESRATLERVSLALEMPAGEFVVCLHEIEESGLVVAGGTSVRCKHDLVSTISLSISTIGVQSFLRARVARALEREADETQSVELLGDCVTHYERAGELRRAFEAARKLGHRLLALGMGEDAIGAFQSAMRCSQTASDELLAVEGCILASHLSGNWHRTAMYLGTRRSHLMRTGGSSATLTDYELIEQDSLFYQEGRDWNPGTVLGWAGDVRHSSRYRFRAAAIACIFGDNHYEASLIAKAYELVRDLAPADLFSDDAALLELLYHTCIGDARSVPAIAHQYAQMVRRSPDKLIHIRGLRRAGNALNRVGLFTEALEYLTEALLLAEKLNLPVQQCSAHAHLAIAYIELADVDNARSQLVRLHEAEANAPTDTNPRAVDCYAMILAWLTSDTTLAMSQLQRFPAPSDRILDAPAHYLLASRIGLQSIVDASTLSEADLTACRRLYERGKAFGQQDLRTSMMLAGMTARGAVGEAREIATRYLADFRRDLSMPRTKQLVTD